MRLFEHIFTQHHDRLKQNGFDYPKIEPQQLDRIFLKEKKIFLDNDTSNFTYYEVYVF